MSVGTPDGARLAVTRIRPRGRARAVCLAAHAMMASSAYMRSRGFAGHLADRGIDVFLLDFRGHGASYPAPPWTFDDLVAFDLPAAVWAVSKATGAGPGEMVFLGHSLGGLVGLAAFATGRAPAPARIVLASTSLWLEGRGGSLARRGLMTALAASGAVSGWVPIRRLRIGTADEPYPYMAQLAGWALSGRWTSLGGLDYREVVARLHTPALAVTGEGDRLCRPADAEAMRAVLPGAAPLRRVGVRHGDALDPDHFTMFTRPALAPVWDELASWLSGEGERA